MDVPLVSVTRYVLSNWRWDKIHSRYTKHCETIQPYTSIRFEWVESWIILNLDQLSERNWKQVPVSSWDSLIHQQNGNPYSYPASYKLQLEVYQPFPACWANILFFNGFFIWDLGQFSPRRSKVDPKNGRFRPFGQSGKHPFLRDSSGW